MAETIKNRPVDTTMVFLKPPGRPRPRRDQPPPDVIVAANPPPKGFQTVVAPTDIPKDIPPIDLNEKPFDPKDFTGKGVEGGIATGIVGRHRPGDRRGVPGGAAGRSGPADLHPDAALSAGAAERRASPGAVDAAVRRGHHGPRRAGVVQGA